MVNYYQNTGQVSRSTVIRKDRHTARLIGKADMPIISRRGRHDDTEQGRHRRALSSRRRIEHTNSQAGEENRQTWRGNCAKK